MIIVVCDSCRATRPQSPSTVRPRNFGSMAELGWIERTDDEGASFWICARCQAEGVSEPVAAPASDRTELRPNAEAAVVTEATQVLEPIAGAGGSDRTELVPAPSDGPEQTEVRTGAAPVVTEPTRVLPARPDEDS